MRTASTTALNSVGSIGSSLEDQAIWRLWRLLLSGVAVALFGLPLAVSSPGSEQPKPTESEIQAAYLYNFGKFVLWPAGTAVVKSDSFQICVFGQDPFGPTLDATIAGGIIGGKGVVAKRIADAHEAAGCQILFISSSEDTRLRKILEVLNKAAVLTVSDMPQFSQRGGMIQFVLERNKVRFEVDLTATQSAGLTLSSELLKVAAAVKRAPTPG